MMILLGRRLSVSYIMPLFSKETLIFKQSIPRTYLICVSEIQLISSGWTLVVIWKTRMKMTTLENVSINWGKPVVCIWKGPPTCLLIGKSFEVVPAFQLLLEKLKGGDSSAALSSIYIVILKLLVKVKFVGLGTKTTLFEPFSSAIKRFIRKSIIIGRVYFWKL